jgi:hypothetical protein
MWSVLIAALGMAASRSALLGDPEHREFVASFLLVVLACPVFAFGIAAFARWAFTPLGEGTAPAQDDSPGPPR